MAARRVGFSSSKKSSGSKPKTGLQKAVLRLALLEFLGIIALAAALIYLHTEFWQIFGAEPHLLSGKGVINATIAAVGAFMVYVVLLFVSILLPPLREAWNAR